VTGVDVSPPYPVTVDAEIKVNPRESSFLISLLVPILIGSYLFLTSTTYLIPGIWPYDSKRILQFVLLLILFLVPALNERIRNEYGCLLAAVPAWIKIALLCMFGWGIVSALTNAHSLMHALNSLSEVALLSALVLGVFVVAACRRIAGHWFDRTAVALIALTGLAVGMQDLVGATAAHFAEVEFNFGLSLIYFSWPRFYNQVQTWMVPALVALPLLFARYRLASIVCFIVLGLQWYIILATGARGSFISISAAVVIAMILLPTVRYRLLKWQAFGFALGVLIFALVAFSFEAGGQTSNAEAGSGSIQHPAVRPADRKAGGGMLPGAESSFFRQSLGRPMANTSGRTWMWSVTVRDSRNHPLLGIGPMNYVCTSPNRIGHPHNFPLQLAAEWGIPVALAACVVFLVLLTKGWQSIRRDEYSTADDGATAGLLLTAVLAAAFHACLSGVMVMPASQVTGLLICGMLLGLYPSASGERRVAALHWGFIPGLLLSVGLLGLGVHELKTMEDRESALLPRDNLLPRIWQNAKVCTLYIPQNDVK
jgi:hypothetical protein